jgi:ElaB/YqjD/DUF883 family membrane-anchored ribosome-binding protein
MNEKQMDKKIQQDSENVKKDINTLMDDGVTRLTKGLEKITGEAKESLTSTADTVKKDIGQGLKQYNARADEFAKSVPGDLGKKVSQYPWVAISIGLVIGLLLGDLFRNLQRS